MCLENYNCLQFSVIEMFLLQSKLNPVNADTEKKSILTLSLPNVDKGKFRPSLQISFCNIFKNK